MKTFRKLISITLCLIMVFGSVAVGGQGFAEVLEAIGVKVSAFETEDDYPDWLKKPDPDTICKPESWNFYNRECTSFVAWRMNSTNNIQFSNQHVDNVAVTNPAKPDGDGSKLGHAMYWKAALTDMGYVCNSTPAVGSIAWTAAGGFGHVAWVSSVNEDGDATLEEYNYIPAYGYANDRVLKKASNYSGYEFIHVRDYDDICPQIVDSKVIASGISKEQFTVSAEVTDNVGVTEVYATVVDYGGEESHRFDGSVDGNTASVCVDLSCFSSEVDVYKLTFSAADSWGNTTTIKISNYVDVYALTFGPGTHKVVTAMSDVCEIPYRFYNGKSTGLLCLAKEKEFTVVGFYTNKDGERWAKMDDGNWIFADDIDLVSNNSQFDNFLDYSGGTVFYMSNQLVKPSDASRTKKAKSSSSTINTYATLSGSVSSKKATLNTNWSSADTFEWTKACGESVYWEFLEKTGELLINGYGAMDYNTVPWKEYKTKIKTVTIADGITSIGKEAFYNCTGLTSVTIPESVTSIGGNAFCGCTGLTSITIPGSVTSIGSRAFYDCTGLTEINWDAKNCADYNGSPFYSAGSSASGITVTFGNSVETVPAHLFSDVINLKTIIFGNRTTSIGEYAFSECTGLTGVSIPSSVTNIGGNAFYGCTGLTSVTIGNGVKSIGKYAFNDCSGLTNITIPDSVTSAEGSAFSGCTGLTAINWNAKNCVCYNGSPFYSAGSSANGITVTFGNSVEAVPAHLFSDVINLKTIIFGNRITSIGEYAFSECTGLTGVSIPSSVTNIGGNAFYKCTGLTNITIPGSVTSIGDYAFYGCTGLTRVTIPNSVTSMGFSTFGGCAGLKSAGPIGGGYDYEFGWTNLIPDDAFSCCTSLTSVTIPLSVTSIGGYAFYKCTGLTDVTIPNFVSNIGGSAFSGCTSLKSVTIPKNVKSVGGSAFSECTGLTEINWNAKNYEMFAESSESGIRLKPVFDFAGTAGDGITVTFGDSVERIPAYMFRHSTEYDGAANIVAVNIGKNVTSIGDYAFYGCAGITSITIPENVTSIGISAFYGCSGITELNWNAKNCAVPTFGDSPFISVGTKDNGFFAIFGDAVETIPAYSFWHCEGLTDVIIGASVTSIEDFAFCGCANLSTINWNAKSVDNASNYSFYDIGTNGFTVTFGNGVESIPAWIFSSCASLTSVSIPESVTSIGDCAFISCTGLTDVYYAGSKADMESIVPSEFLGVYFPKEVTWHYGKEESITPFNPDAEVVTSGKCGIKVYYCLDSDGTLLIDGSFGTKDLERMMDYDVPWSNYNDDIKKIVFRNVFYIAPNIFIGLKNLREIDIGSGIAEIGAFAFNDCQSLQKVSIAEGLAQIDFGAFSACTALTEIKLPESLTYIGTGAFNNCTGLKSIVIPSNVAVIDTDAFSYCTGLTSVTIPKSVEYIGEKAFFNCNALKDVYYSGTKAEWNNIKFFYYNEAGNALTELSTLSSNDCLLDSTIHCADGVIKAKEDLNFFERIIESIKEVFNEFSYLFNLIKKYFTI